jgi:hypothetical protein
MLKKGFDGIRSLAVAARKDLWLQRAHSEPRAQASDCLRFFSNLFQLVLAAAVMALAILLKTVLMLVEMPGTAAIAATVTSAAMRAYSIMS